MKKLLTISLLLSAGLARAQVGYTYVVEAPIRTEDEMIPAYRTLADTAGKPFTKLFRHSKLTVVGRVGTRWAVVEKADVKYAIRTDQLPAEAQQVVMTAHAIRAIPFDPTTGQIDYSEVIQVPGASQVELYTRAKLWFASTFASARDVVQADEKDAGIIQGTGFRDIYVTSLGLPSKMKLWYTVKLALKDGRYKYDVTDLRVQSYPNQYYPNPGAPSPAEPYISADAKKGTFSEVARSAHRSLAVASDETVESIITGMSKPAAGTAGGKDW